MADPARAVPPLPTEATRGALWRTSMEREAVDRAFARVGEILDRQLRCWSLGTEEAGPGEPPDHCCALHPWWGSDSVYDENTLCACLLYTLYACRLALNLITLHRLTMVDAEGAPDLQTESMTSARLMRLGLSDARLHDLLYPTDANDPRAVAVYWDCALRFQEEVLRVAWMASVLRTVHRLPFRDAVLRLVHRSRGSDADLLRRLCRWRRQIEGWFTHRSDPCPNPPELHCINAAHHADRLPVGVWQSSGQTLYKPEAPVDDLEAHTACWAMWEVLQPTDGDAERRAERRTAIEGRLWPKPEPTLANAARPEGTMTEEFVHSVVHRVRFHVRLCSVCQAVPRA